MTALNRMTALEVCSDRILNNCEHRLISEFLDNDRWLLYKEKVV